MSHGYIATTWILARRDCHSDTSEGDRVAKYNPSYYVEDTPQPSRRRCRFGRRSSLVALLWCAPERRRRKRGANSPVEARGRPDPVEGCKGVQAPALGVYEGEGLSLSLPGPSVVHRMGRGKAGLAQVGQDEAARIGFFLSTSSWSRTRSARSAFCLWRRRRTVRLSACPAAYPETAR